VSSQTNLLELNRDCDCFPIARARVDEAVLSLSDHPKMAEMLAVREHYFASTPIFIAPEMVTMMEQQITAIEEFIKQPAFQNEIFQRSALAAFAPTKFTRGVFMGYDFHITADGPRLIEINSNAGGAFIVNAIQKAVGLSHADFEKDVANMFLSEWNLAQRTDDLITIAIVDEAPERDPAHGLLRQAWLDEAVVITPDPRHHALYADKRNLMTLSDRQTRKELGVSPELDRILSALPATVEVTSQNAEHLWAQRKSYFFKPFTGFGGRAVYKGAKLTKKTWAHILDGGYIAQKLIKPPSRLISAVQPARQQKYDVRIYSYNGVPLMMGARVYQGQVTNLRTAGGGLAPIIQYSNPTCHK